MSNENTMENFWGCTLIKGKNEYSWSPVETEEDVEHKLQVTSACLGPRAKDGERNLVEVTTEDERGNQTTCSIVSLRLGQKECFHLELGFNNPTKFSLREGSGPVSLCGVHLQAGPIDFSDIDDNEDTDLSGDEDIPNLVEVMKTKKELKSVEAKKPKVVEPTAKKPGKRPLEEDKKQDKQVLKKKKSQPEPEPESEEDDDEEEDGEEESGEEDSADEEMPSLLDGEAEENDNEESEDEDEPEGESVDEEDDEDSEDDGEEEESDEEEDETPIKPQKKQMTNGHTPKNKQADKKDQSKKTPAKTPSTKTPQKTPAKKTTEEIKAMLLKSPNLPKKMDKFENYMKNNMKVTDKKTLNDVWEFVQKNRK